MFFHVIGSIIGFLLFIFFKSIPIWAPIVLIEYTIHLWHHYVQEQFLSGIDWVLLEVRIPRDVTKTPHAMELFLSNALYQMSVKGLYEIYWQGAIRFFFSLEICSINGSVHFFIRTPSRVKDLVVTQLYAQYPQAEVYEVEDYTNSVPEYKDDGNWYLWGCEFKYAKHDAYPIRTYVDFMGLDKPGVDEEYKIDPLTPTIEHLGSLQDGQQVWTQLIVRPSEKEWHTHGTFHKHHRMDQEIDFELERLVAPYTTTRLGADNKIGKEVRVPDTIKDEVEGIREKAAKLMFDVGIRLVVLAEKKKVSLYDFNNLRRASRLLYRQYSTVHLNRLERFHSTQFDYPWADPFGTTLEFMKDRMLYYFRDRTMFHPPVLMSFNYPWPINFFFPSFKPEYNVLNAEELATLFHFPGRVSETPTFKRKDVRTAKPPFNLPT